MCRHILVVILLGLGSWGLLAPCGSAAQPKRSVADLIAELKKGDNEKLKAIEELEALGDKAADAVPALIGLLSYKNEEVRLHVVMAMKRIGTPVVEPLTTALSAHYPAAGKFQPRRIASLIRKLGSGNFAERDKARKDLEAIGLPALEALHKASKGGDLETNRRAVELVKTIEGYADIRFYMVWGLAFVGPPAKSATPVVIKALADPSAAVRRKAAYALGRIDADPDQVVVPLVAALGDADTDVREAAAAVLPKMSKVAVPVMIEALKGDNKNLLVMAMKILGATGAEGAAAIPELKRHLLEFKGFAEPAADALSGIGAKSIPALTAVAAEADAPARALAVNALFRVGAPAVPTFVDMLGSKHVDVQRHVAALLGNMQVFDKSVVIGLGFATKDKDFQVRLNALQSLQRMGTNSKVAEPYIVVLLTDLDPQIRLTAFHTLTSLGVDPRPGLKKALGHAELATRITTASLMSQLNLELALAEPILLEGLKAKDEALKMQAAHALSLRGLQENEVLPIFLDGLKNKLPSVRRQAAESIARYGAKASKAAPALIGALDDPDDSVCAAALAAVRVVGADPKTLFPAMVKVLRRKDTALHATASQTIFQVGPDAIDEIVSLLKKEEAPGIRLACLQTLAMVGPRAKDGVGELIKALDDPAARARMTAARALGNIGPDAKAAEDALTKAAKDADANVKQIAEAALTQIKADPNQKGFEVKGVLTPGDPFDRVRTQHFHVVHTYQMKAGQTYTIDLNSQWDNYLRLENALGVQLAQDDDSGGFPNARIIFRAPADGWYRIIVTSFGAGASGPYTLRVK
jgi:HEAT repeat protein